MSKVMTVVLALFAVFAIGAVATASASASQFLVKGETIKTGESRDFLLPGTILLLVLGATGGTIHLVCSVVLHGTLLSGGVSHVTKFLNLSNQEPLWINCEILHTDLGGCTGSLLILFMPLHLPFEGKLEEPKAGEVIFNLSTGTGGEPGYETECTGPLGIKVKEHCEGGLKTDKLSNGTKGVFGEFLNQLSTKCGNASVSAHIYGGGESESPSGVVSFD